jgi:hypothetical protein
MTDTELASILTYLEFQRIRVPRQAQAAKELLKGVLLLNSSPEVASSIMEGKVKVTVNDSFRFDFMRMVLGKFHPYFSRMNWEVVKAANGCEFIISDSPVSFFNVGFPPPTEAGIALAGTTVFYPFNPKQLLVLRYPEYMTEQELDPLTRIPEPELRDGLLKVTFGSVWEEERVNHTNWIMMQLADRYIGASRKDVLDRCVGTSVRGN